MAIQGREGKEAEGPYRSYYASGEISAEGFYKNNKKDGVWRRWTGKGKIIDSAFYRDGYIQGLSLRWSPEGQVIDSLVFEEGGKGISRGYWPSGIPSQRGAYEKGKRTGNWVYYHKNGNRSQEVMFVEDSAVSFTCYDEQGNLQASDCYFEKEAEFRGGDGAWRNYLGKRLSSSPLPKDYLKGKVHGVVYAQFVVAPDGKLTEIKLLNKLHPELDKIVLNILNTSPRWEPAIQYNRKVNAYRKQPVVFAQVK